MPGGDKPQSTGYKPALNQIKDDLLPGIKEYGSQYGQGQGLYEGSQLADLDPNIRAAQESALGLVPQITDQMGRVTNTLEGFLDYDPNSVQNTAARDALGSNVNAAFSQYIRPAVEDRFTQSGQFGGPQQNVAIGAASGPLSRAIADSEVSLMNADRDRAFNAMTVAPGLLSAQLLPSQIQGDVGYQRSARGQMELADEIQQFEAPRRNQLQSLLEQQGLLSPLVGAGSSYDAGSPSTGARVAGVAGSALAGYAATGSPVGAAIGAGIGVLGQL